MLEPIVFWTFSLKAVLPLFPVLDPNSAPPNSAPTHSSALDFHINWDDYDHHSAYEQAADDAEMASIAQNIHSFLDDSDISSDS